MSSAHTFFIFKSKHISMKQQNCTILSVITEHLYTVLL